MNDPQESPEHSETIELAQFLKLCHVASTGGHAKMLIQGGMVTVNGEVEMRRRRKLRHGDVVECEGETFVIEAD